MISFWRLFRKLKPYLRFLVPITGALLIGLQYLETAFKFWSQLQQQNSVPSGRPFKVGESDGIFHQEHVDIASPKEPIPVGVEPDMKIKAEGKGSLKPSHKPTKERPTRDVIKDLDQYL